ncbi:MAG: hypothetical protein ACO3P7_05185 [bacterium]
MLAYIDGHDTDMRPHRSIPRAPITGPCANLEHRPNGGVPPVGKFMNGGRKVSNLVERANRLLSVVPIEIRLVELLICHASCVAATEVAFQPSTTIKSKGACHVGVLGKDQRPQFCRRCIQHACQSSGTGGERGVEVWSHPAILGS